MTHVGEVFEHTQAGFRLAICGGAWDFEKTDTGVLLAQAQGMPDHATALQCALMCARVYVPDFYMLEPSYEKFRDELLEETNQNEPDFKEWLRERHQEVVNGFLTTLDGDKGKYKLEDLLAFGRRQYARFLGKGV